MEEHPENYKPKFRNTRLGALLTGLAGTGIGLAVRINSLHNQDLMGTIIGACVIGLGWVAASMLRDGDKSEQAKKWMDNNKPD